MTSRRAQRRRVPQTIPLRLTSRHGRVTFVFDTRVGGAVRVIGEHEQSRQVDIAFPHESRSDDGSIALFPGLCDPAEVLAWAAGAPAQIADHVGHRVLVNAVCEHIRDQEAARFGWDRYAPLVESFAEFPTHWLVYAAMPTSRPATHDLSDFPTPEVAS